MYLEKRIHGLSGRGIKVIIGCCGVLLVGTGFDGRFGTTRSCHDDLGNRTSCEQEEMGLVEDLGVVPDDMMRDLPAPADEGHSADVVTLYYDGQ